jgi:ATP adenylyltransferase
MRMSHIYQPVMIKTLLAKKGKCSKSIIAQEILRYDFSQVEYYENVTNKMVGRVLRNHQIVEKEGSDYSLVNYDKLSKEEISLIINLCNQKINDYIENRGKKIWEHRRRNRKAISGSIRYKVLSRASGRCELCGISSKEKALEVDHIVPKNLGGEDSVNNYQALCYTCNANKRDSDSTDFRGLENFYRFRSESCTFCQLDSSRIIEENNLAIAFYDKYPVTRNHCIVIPKRHIEEYFDLTQPEKNSMDQLLITLRDTLQKEDPSIQGYNIGINNGEIAGEEVTRKPKKNPTWKTFRKRTLQ